jgi:hypothetical protein
MAEGSAIDAPVSGVVRFAGRVPGVGGGTVLAVSIEGVEGVVTLLPLEEASVSQGEGVEAGAEVGCLAGSGDASSAESHLHIGLKRGSVYLDPTPLMEGVPAQGAEPGAEPQTEAAPDPSPAPSAAPAPAPARAEAPAGATLPASEPACDAAPEQTLAGVGPTPGAVAAPAAGQLAPGVTLVANSPGSAPAVRSEASGAQRLVASIRGGAAGGREARQVFVRGAWGPAVGLLAAALFASALLVTRRALERRVAARGPVSDRLGILLQHLKAGDTLCGLTSCSGPLPSQSRGH